MANELRNVVVVGGSYVGMETAKELAKQLPPTHRVLLVEPHTHFHHLFAFPRFAILPGEEHKSFIPYSGLFSSSSPHRILRAKAISLPSSHTLRLDRPVSLFSSDVIEFEYLVAATGTHLSAPGTLPHDSKPANILFLQRYQTALSHAKSVMIVGGGAVGVQMACDLAELYPAKKVVLVHSREHLMTAYHPALSNLIKERFKELGVELITGERVVIPASGFPSEAQEEGIEVKLQSGRTLKANFVVLATGQKANNAWLTGPGLLQGEEGVLLNEKNGFVRVRPTMQFAAENLGHCFAVGDINDCGMHKAARPGYVQAGVAARNIVRMIKGEEANEEIVKGVAGIHLTLGLKQNVIFRNPNTAAGDTEPFINRKEDGQEDMNIDAVWIRRGVQVATPQEYHL
ncbi:hypothetical protein QBC35DRAFT_387634 [Podospora australis]|uniref:FAD/NAD(P)-binding domain-containing protein n=1 Tax=Podospora australis TaxID=1536484 RepID=A0AAN7AH03_9PEZI|nr:hypothetical protein QBC35DRAFT_387634 [Podospora australis]